MNVDIDRRRFTGTTRELAAAGRVDGSGLDRVTLTDADADAREWYRRERETEESEKPVGSQKPLVPQTPVRIGSC